MTLNDVPNLLISLFAAAALFSTMTFGFAHFMLALIVARTFHPLSLIPFYTQITSMLARIGARSGNMDEKEAHQTLGLVDVLERTALILGVEIVIQTAIIEMLYSPGIKTLIAFAVGGSLASSSFIAYTISMLEDEDPV